MRDKTYGIRSMRGFLETLEHWNAAFYYDGKPPFCLLDRDTVIIKVREKLSEDTNIYRRLPRTIVDRLVRHGYVVTVNDDPEKDSETVVTLTEVHITPAGIAYLRSFDGGAK